MDSETHRLKNPVLVEKKLIQEAEQALQDWITTYAADCCSEQMVDEACERIQKNGGTIYYAAEIAKRLQEAINQ